MRAIAGRAAGLERQVTVIKSDVAVLGAGIIGVSTALHLQARGRSVVLVDRRGPGEETSHGNAGLIERASVVPYAFPRSLTELLRYASNRRIDARYHWSFLPRIAPWLFQYWRHSSPARLAEAARAMLPLIERCLDAVNDLLQQAGITHLARETGWLMSGGQAQRTANGMLIEINYNGRTAPLVSQLLGAVPSGQLPADPLIPQVPLNTSPQALFNLLKETYITDLALAPGAVQASAPGASARSVM